MCMTCICWRSRSASWRCSSIALDPDSSHTPRSEKMQDMSKAEKECNGQWEVSGQSLPIVKCHHFHPVFLHIITNTHNHDQNNHHNSKSASVVDF